MSKEVYCHLRGELSPEEIYRRVHGELLPEDFESERRSAERISLTELARHVVRLARMRRKADERRKKEDKERTP
jgi:hypothetical protein